MKKLEEVFDIWYGVNLEMINCEEDAYGIPFVSRTSANNGIVGYVKEIEGVEPNPSYTLSVACGGSVLSTFYHTYKYYSGRDVYILKPKMSLTHSQMLFYCAVIEKNKYRYNYGRQANKTLRNILVPSPDDIPREIKNHKIKNAFKKDSIIKRRIYSNTDKWKSFRLDELFDIYTSVEENMSDREDGSTPYISSTQLQNGISKFVIDQPTQEANTITVARNGSVGSCFFHPYPYCASPDDVRIFKPKFTINVFIAIFIITLIEKEKYRYAYGRKFGTKRMKATKIKLPVTSNDSPDWKFIEDYIKSLPYSSSL